MPDLIPGRRMVMGSARNVTVGPGRRAGIGPEVSAAQGLNQLLSARAPGHADEDAIPVAKMADPPGTILGTPHQVSVW
jgi:hypothetical protein